jgi:hypothetical protein
MRIPSLAHPTLLHPPTQGRKIKPYYKLRHLAKPQ